MHLENMKRLCGRRVFCIKTERVTKTLQEGMMMKYSNFNKQKDALLHRYEMIFITQDSSKMKAKHMSKKLFPYNLKI
jgi:16S rRNA C1402 (ribose-2'-O) methylase RsmI